MPGEGWIGRRKAMKKLWITFVIHSCLARAIDYSGNVSSGLSSSSILTSLYVITRT